MIRASGGNFGQDTRVTHLLFTRSAMGFLMTTESQDLGLMSHPKDVFNIEVQIPHFITHSNLFSQGQVCLLLLTDYFITNVLLFLLKQFCIHKINYYVILPPEDARFVGINERSSLLLFGIIAIEVTHFKVRLLQCDYTLYYTQL